MMNDKGRPEPVLFLLAARDAMEAFRAEHREYAKRWCDLEIEFAAGPYHVGDPGTRPTPENGPQWRPLRCQYSYVIDSATAVDYVVYAINRDGKVEFKVQAGMEYPVRID